MAESLLSNSELGMAASVLQRGSDVLKQIEKSGTLLRLDEASRVGIAKRS
jgi:hypothetical protein